MCPIHTAPMLITRDPNLTTLYPLPLLNQSSVHIGRGEGHRISFPHDPSGEVSKLMRPNCPN